jgi:ABC-type sulfate transport system permease subunit
MKFFSLNHVWVLFITAILGWIWYDTMRPIDWVILYGVILGNARALTATNKENG